MPKRPLVIVIIALLYLLSPLFIIFQAAYFYRVPIIGYNNLFTHLLLPDILILFIYPLCAIAVYLVKKWGWYLFIGCSLYLIIYNVVVFITTRQYHVMLLLFYNILIGVIGAVFFRKNVIAPYFNPHLRWWEAESRYKIDINIELIKENDLIKSEILDISESGCFIASQAELKVGIKYEGIVNCMRNSVRLQFKVMRKSTNRNFFTGYGIMFINLEEKGSEGIKRIIKDLEKANLKDEMRDAYQKIKGAKVASRYRIDNHVLIINQDFSINGYLLNISKNGCLAVINQVLNFDHFYELKINCMKIEVKIQGEVKWKTSIDNKDAYGISFRNLNKEEQQKIHQILLFLKKSGSIERLKTAKPLPLEMLDNYVVNTPYRGIIFIKKMLFRH